MLLAPMPRAPDDPEHASPPMTSMIDVIFLLLVFFVCAAVGKAPERFIDTPLSGGSVDAAMVDGVGSLMTAVYGMYAAGVVTNDRGTNILDGGAHFYDTYETSDGKFVSIGSIEPQFYAELLEKLGLQDDEKLPHQMDRSGWPLMKARFETLLRSVSKRRANAERK